ncbi:MAG: glycosyltransferase family 2 protein [Lachnospiraceae bacterium]|nr:glycosyltransferase family 2 protein [Lachnospiraceae bacterium]
MDKIDDMLVIQENDTIPLVSVIIPTYNRVNVLGRSIDSVLNQSFTAFELIIADDCSTDRTKELVDSYQDERIRYIKNDTNLGEGGARNAGAAVSRGKYIAFNDSDDIWYTEKLSRLIEFINDSDNDNIGMVYHLYRYFSSENPLDSVIVGGKIQTDYFSNLLFQPDIGAPTMFITKEAWDCVGGFLDTLRCLGDWEFSIRIAERYDIIFLPEVLLDAFRLDDGICINMDNRMAGEFYILNRHLRHFISYNAAKVKFNNIIRQSLRPINYEIYLRLFLELIERMQKLEMWEAISAMLEVHESYYE